MVRMFTTTPNRMTVFGVAGALAAVAFVGLPTQAQQQGQGDDSITVGTVQAQQVYQNYDGRQQMMQQIRQIQQEARQAQQNGNQQQARQKQQQMQQKQQEIMQKFRSNMEKATQQVAEDQDIDLVAQQVSYASDRVQTQDITEPVTQALNEMVDVDDQQQGQSRQLPGAGQQQRQGQQNRQPQQPQGGR